MTFALDDIAVILTCLGGFRQIYPLTPGPKAAHVRQSGGAVLIDSRVPDSRSGVTIPGAVNIPHDRIIGFRDQLDLSRLSVFFCNGPQCPQSPAAIRALLETGYPASGLAYYRGGLHDWVTLAMPTEQIT